MRWAASAAWRWYSSQMVAHPLRTNCVTGGAVMLVGDTAAQQLEDRKRHPQKGGWCAVDVERSAVTTAWASCVVSPLFFYWFQLLDARWPGAAARAVVTKVAVNQLLVPIPLNGGFLAFSTTAYAVLAAAKGQGGGFDARRTADQVSVRVTHCLKELVMGSMVWWTIVNVLNFSLVPPTFRILPTIFGSAAWNTYLSIRGHEDV